MWITKLKLRHADCPIVRRCEKFDLTVLSYPTTHYVKAGKKYATTTCYFQDHDEKKKKQFLGDLKKDKRLTNLEIAGDIFTYEINLGTKGEHVMLYHTPQTFFVKPVINSSDGHEYWEVASWEKKELEKFIAQLREHMQICIILKMEKSTLNDVYFPNIMPSLTKNQKKALELAYMHGYYAYPHKVNLAQLARIAKVSISTFQEHLRKAEMKLLPILIGRVLGK
ncbi:helix-turn-helix domain-containing protein [Candidatus Woesearchaeota archaeon]|nr:helix-turn-helix domain-containing protein [Candidatus Woesearchaeota archaeon]